MQANVYYVGLCSGGDRPSEKSAFLHYGNAVVGVADGRQVVYKMQDISAIEF